MGSTAITYDALGNPLTYGTAAYTWQNGRQLASISMNYGAMVYSFEYNDSGIRTSKTVNGIEHVYTLNGSQIVTESWTQSDVEHVIVYLYDESGAPIGMQYRTSEYAWREFDNYFFEKNLFGDVVAIYNESGTKIGSYKYDAWGVCTPSVEPAASTFEKKVVRTLNPFRYRGYYYDTETGFYYLQSRYYNPQWGRFLNADGYINANGDLIGFNMYAYCGNNPVMYTDPTGERATTWKIVIFVAAVATVVAVTAVAVYATVQTYRSSDDNSHIGKASDINLDFSSEEGTKEYYNFDYNGKQYSAIYSTDSAEWHINNSYQIENHDDLVLICSELIETRPVPGIAENTNRTASDLAYEWEQHNLAYYYLEPLNISWKDNVANVDLDRDDQYKSLLEMAWDRITN